MKKNHNEKLLNTIRVEGQQFFRKKTPDIDLTRILKPQPLFQRKWRWIFPSLLSAMTVFVLTSILLASTQPQGNFSQLYPGLVPLNQVGLPLRNERDQTLTFEDGLPTYDDITQSVNMFNVAVMRQLNATSNNVLFSPVSAFTTLALLYEASAEDSASALANVLGVTNPLAFREAMLQMMIDLVYDYRTESNPNQELILAQSLLANGIFIRDGFTVEQAYLDTVGQDYLTEVFQTEFTGQGLTNITDWIRDKTNGFLALQAEDLRINVETMMLIINTLFLQSHWQTAYTYLRDNQQNLVTLPFLNEVNEVTNDVPMMQKTIANTYYRQDELYQIASDDLASQGDNRFVVVLPEPGVTVQQLFEPSTYARILTDIAAPVQGTKLTLTMPAVSVQSSLDLTELLQEPPFSLSAIFQPDTANLSKAFAHGYVQAIVQDTRLELTDIGLTLAAVTQAATGTTSTPELGPIEATFTLDRSFAFFVINRQGLIQFTGIVNQPKTL